MAVVAIYWLLEDKRGRLYLAQYVSKNAGYWILHNKPVRSEPDGVKRHLQIYKARLTEFIGNNFI